MNEKWPHAVTDREAAKVLGLSVATLRAWRLRRRGPRYLRFGRAVRYLIADLDRFIESNTIDPRPGPVSRRQPL